MDVVVICKFDKQFPKNALLSCTQTIEVACIVLVSNLSEHREAAPSRPCERKQAEPAVALFCLRLDPALRIEFVDDFGNCTSGQPKAICQLAGRSLSAVVKLAQEHPFRDRSLLLVEGAGERS